MTVLEFQRYKLKMSIIRKRLNAFVEKHPELVNELDAWYLPVIDYMLDLEHAIDHAIDRTEVDF